MKIIRVAWYIIKLFIHTILAVFAFVIAAFVRIFDLRLAIDIFRNHLRIFCKLFGLDVQFEFEEVKTKTARNTVFVMLNQSSFLDSMIVPMHPVKNTLGIINIEMALYPLIGWFYAIINFVIIRQWARQAKKNLKSHR